MCMCKLDFSVQICSYTKISHCIITILGDLSTRANASNQGIAMWIALLASLSACCNTDFTPETSLTIKA